MENLTFFLFLLALILILGITSDNDDYPYENHPPEDNTDNNWEDKP